MIPDSKLDENSAILFDALLESNANIEAAIRNLDIDALGNLKSTKINITRTKSMQKLIIAELTTRGYASAVKEVTDSYYLVPEYVKEAFAGVNIDTAFTIADESIIKTMAKASSDELLAASYQWAVDISNDVYVAVLSSSARKDVILSAKQRLVGLTDKRGRAMSSHAATIVNTRYAETDTAVMLNQGELAGIDKWRYTGTTIADSRHWCVTHLNKVYTMAEIKAWANSEWSGKKGGDPFIVRGGWACRHSWSPVVE